MGEQGEPGVALPWLAPTPVEFPDPAGAHAEPDGLLAAGGELSLPWLLEAYSQGIFPWFNDDEEPILWWSPNPRGVLIPGQIHLSRSLRKRLKRCGFTLSMDTAFTEVIHQCAAIRARTGTWITPNMQQAYLELHNRGYAHSIEIWDGEHLVGGLYGVSLGQMFFGESMFSLADDASKMALHSLSEHSLQWGFSLLDCQMMTDHLHSMGAMDLARPEFLEALRHNRQQPTKRGLWTDSIRYTTAAELGTAISQRLAHPANEVNDQSERA